MSTTITFTYLNHNGKKSERTVDVGRLSFLTRPDYGYQPGWFITGWCHEKKAVRSFALSRIIFEGENSITVNTRELFRMNIGEQS